MKLFLLSDSLESVRDDDGNKIAVNIVEKNEFKENLFQLIRNGKKFLFICNTPEYEEYNENSAKCIFDALIREGLGYTEYVVLDNRTKDRAKELILGADLIYIQGGDIDPVLNFLDSVNGRECLRDTNAVIVGKSAGAMICSEDIYYYPETNEQVGHEKWVKGYGYVDITMIPHFTFDKGNMYCFGDFDLLNDYYLPDSIGHKIYAIPNGSYIMVDSGVTSLYGEAYIISDGKVEKICDDDSSVVLSMKL